MIELHNLNVNLGQFRLKDIDLSIDSNDFFVLMGPTGAGKTVLLEAIAGLVPLERGRITIAGRDVTGTAPEKRGVSIMYQDYALFPHLTIAQNISFGVRYHAKAKNESGSRFERLVRELNIGHLLNRYPENLSGGELQRAALARALMVEPQVILLDEPLSALDPGFREEIRLLLKNLHASSGMTFFMVTHDFAEALSLATTAAVMNNGIIEQTGGVQEIFQKPCSSFVADFVGMRNIFPARFYGHSSRLGSLTVEMAAVPVDTVGFIAIRPEDIVISTYKLDSSMRNSFCGVVSAIIDQGFSYEVHVQVEDLTFKSLITKGSLLDLGIREGLEVHLSFKATAIHCF